MYKLTILNFLLAVLFVGCQEVEKIMTNMPDTKPPLFHVQTGLSPELFEEQVVFEKYVQTRMGTAVATKLYANGDYYKIYLGSNESLKEDSISWKKIDVISQKQVEKIQNISNASVVDFINKGPHKKVTGAVENVNWYFYFDEPKFVQSQLRQWQLFGKPEFVRKMNKIIE